MLVHELVPLPITEIRRAPSRVDDVREEDGREHAVRLGIRSIAGEEFLDLGEHRIRVACPDQVLVSWELDEAGARNLLGEPP